MDNMVGKQQEEGWQALSFSSHDGLRLAARHYAAPSSKTGHKAPPPLLCLSSLTGNSIEFDALARFLSTRKDQPRDVFALDYRGRGRSQHDKSSSRYNSYVELRDILDFLIAFDISRFDVLGSSRGGINAMLLATVRPSAIRRIILNDLGPVLEPSGLARMLGLLTNIPIPGDWPQACDIMHSMYHRQFPALGDDDWLALAKRTFVEKKGRLKLSYDERLAIHGRHFDLQKTIPDMWGQYLALFPYPLLIIRGETSDILSRQTLEHMRTLHWRARAVTVPGQGHAPLLRDKPSMATIKAFLDE